MCAGFESLLSNRTKEDIIATCPTIDKMAVKSINFVHSLFILAAKRASKNKNSDTISHNPNITMPCPMPTIMNAWLNKVKILICVEWFIEICDGEIVKS